MPDAEVEQVREEYQAHLARFVPTLPDDLQRLARDVNLHDGRIRRVASTSGTLEVLVRAGDLQTGYLDVLLLYGSAEVLEADQHFLENAAGRRDVELLYDELDSSDGRWVHRMLFWPYHEVSVRFAALKLSVAPVTGRFDDGAA
jgi:hypothetical protein